MDWTPDSKSLVFWAGGGIKRLDVASGARAATFRSTSWARASRSRRRASTSTVAPDRFRRAWCALRRVSPDGQRVVFEAFGRLWLRDVAGGEPRRLTRDDGGAFELFPSWSRDGKQHRLRALDRCRRSARFTSSSRRRRTSRAVTAQPGHYLQPRFSPDGALDRVRALDRRRQLTSPLWSARSGIYQIRRRGGEARRLTDKGRNPHFGASGDRIYYTEDAHRRRKAEPAHELVSVDLNGKDRRVHATRELRDATWRSRPTASGWRSARTTTSTSCRCRPAARSSCRSRRRRCRMRRATRDRRRLPELDRRRHAHVDARPDAVSRRDAELFASRRRAMREDARPPKHGERVADLGSRGRRTSRPARRAHRRAHRHDGRRRPGDRQRRDRRFATTASPPSARAGAVQIPAEAKRVDVAGRRSCPGSSTSMRTARRASTTSSRSRTGRRSRISRWA